MYHPTAGSAAATTSITAIHVGGFASNPPTSFGLIEPKKPSASDGRDHARDELGTSLPGGKIVANNSGNPFRSFYQLGVEHG